MWGWISEVISEVGAIAISAECGVESARGSKVGSERSSKYCSEIAMRVWAVERDSGHPGIDQKAKGKGTQLLISFGAKSKARGRDWWDVRQSMRCRRPGTGNPARMRSPSSGESPREMRANVILDFRQGSMGRVEAGAMPVVRDNANRSRRR